jgi:hypothetical protein
MAPSKQGTTIVQDSQRTGGCTSAAHATRRFASLHLQLYHIPGPRHSNHGHIRLPPGHAACQCSYSPEIQGYTLCLPVGRADSCPLYLHIPSHCPTPCCQAPPPGVVIRLSTANPINMSKALIGKEAIGNVIIPTPQLLYAWQTDAYPHGERRTWMPAYSIPLVVVSTVLTALRLTLRLRKRGGGFGLDDVSNRNEPIPCRALLTSSRRSWSLRGYC